MDNSPRLGALVIYTDHDGKDIQALVTAYAGLGHVDLCLLPDDAHPHVLMTVRHGGYGMSGNTLRNAWRYKSEKPE